jgi:hypothetical protein
MKNKRTLFSFAVPLIVMLLLASQGMLKAQETTYKMTTPMPEGILVPEHVDSPLGPLTFFDGFPDNATVDKLYDNLDFQRAVQAYLIAMPAVSMYTFGKGLTGFGPANITISTWETLTDSKTLVLTSNCNSPNSVIWLDLRDGPLVLEIPPLVLGAVNDLWSRYLADLGLVGPDKGKGGKYLLLPPGYQGAIPEGYFVVASPTFEVFCFFRMFAVDGDFQPTIENMKKHTRVYLLSQAGNLPANNFVNISGKELHGIAPSDFKFWEYLNEVVQGEPTESFDRVSLGFFASIGIEKGKPFNPDDRMKKILADASVVGDATARAIAFSIRQKESYFYENSAWRNLFLGGTIFETTPGVLNFDGYVFLYFVGIGLSPAEDIKMIGKGSQYALAFVDASGNPLDGSKNYALHLPPGIPVNNFWSVINYDYQTRSMLQTDQKYPMVSSQNIDLIVNPDRSVDVYVGPKAPEGKENNWIQTIPGKGWFTMLRLYGPLEPWFDKTWRPGEIELTK